MVNLETLQPHRFRERKFIKIRKERKKPMKQTKHQIHIPMQSTANQRGKPSALPSREKPEGCRPVNEKKAPAHYFKVFSLGNLFSPST